MRHPAEIQHNTPHPVGKSSSLFVTPAHNHFLTLIATRYGYKMLVFGTQSQHFTPNRNNFSHRRENGQFSIVVAPLLPLEDVTCVSRDENTMSTRSTISLWRNRKQKCEGTLGTCVRLTSKLPHLQPILSMAPDA